ncbi:hypothetical protein GGU10DRAFT_415572 [Lentinula aff. detonsa]|uniref:DH domain-containing protein n=1 Tax=Lentinula aff. detonsa TaxID=2804958 RepID=A0AA38KXG2_9AGAR|nr:hypothetical protein GGU10DRAFT_415572 [Lentinula aff. detonsa]
MHFSLCQSSLISATALPSTPVTPLSPNSPSEGAKSKKTNPLNDLIDTERAYIDHLTAVIWKVAAAWSRSNLPPPELDTMFRSRKLKEIGMNPSSPKALGDLLMRWASDPLYFFSDPNHFNRLTTSKLHTPRTAQNFCQDSTSESLFSPIQNSGPSSSNFHHQICHPWYYKKLYGRLLKSTAPGRSDHKPLAGAVDSLDRLLDTLEQRESIRVGFPDDSPAPQYSAHELEDEVVLDMRTQSMRSKPDRPICLTD